MCEEFQKVKGNSINDEYATIDEVNNVLEEYAQLTYLDNNYLTKAQIKEEYLNSEEISNLYYDRKDIDEKLTQNSMFSLSIQQISPIVIPNANLEWKIYHTRITKMNYLFDMFQRLVKINPNREYYSAVECDNKYVRKTDYDKLLARVAALEGK